MKKKILIDTKTILPLYIQGFISGIGRSTYELLNALQNKVTTQHPYRKLLVNKA